MKIEPSPFPFLREAPHHVRASRWLATEAGTLAAVGTAGGNEKEKGNVIIMLDLKPVKLGKEEEVQYGEKRTTR